MAGKKADFHSRAYAGGGRKVPGQIAKMRTVRGRRPVFFYQLRPFPWHLTAPQPGVAVRSRLNSMRTIVRIKMGSFCFGREKKGKLGGNQEH